MRHFVAAQKMLDIHKCRDLISLQTIVCMIIFLQSAARISTCYSYTGAAVTAAVQLGLHRKTRNGADPIEAELRKRAFWIVQKTDVYIGQILGLPTLLNLEDVDQDLPLEVDDDYITSEGIYQPLSSSKFTIQAAANAHTSLMLIMGKAVKHLYPTKGPRTKSAQNSDTHVVSYAKIIEVERDLQQWQQQLPYTREVVESLPDYMLRYVYMAPRRIAVDPSCSLILQLRIAYTHVQIILYRPFLHYLIQMNGDGLLDERKKRCALACIKASQDTIAIAKEMETQALVCAASWPSVYTMFLATVSLIFFTAAARVDTPDMVTVREDADRGVFLLKNLICHDLGPRRCLAVLEVNASTFLSGVHKIDSLHRYSATLSRASLAQSKSLTRKPLQNPLIRLPFHSPTQTYLTPNKMYLARVHGIV